MSRARLNYPRPHFPISRYNALPHFSNDIAKLAKSRKLANYLALKTVVEVQTLAYIVNLDPRPWVVAYLEPIRSHDFGPDAVLDATVMTVMTVQALVGTAAIVAPLVVQSRRRDFV